MRRLLVLQGDTAARRTSWRRAAVVAVTVVVLYVALVPAGQPGEGGSGAQGALLAVRCLLAAGRAEEDMPAGGRGRTTPLRACSPYVDCARERKPPAPPSLVAALGGEAAVPDSALDAAPAPLPPPPPADVLIVVPTDNVSVLSLFAAPRADVVHIDYRPEPPPATSLPCAPPALRRPHARAAADAGAALDLLPSLGAHAAKTAAAAGPDCVTVLEECGNVLRECGTVLEECCALSVDAVDSMCAAFYAGGGGGRGTCKGGG